MPEFIYIRSNSENVNRLITVLAGYPFYLSSGYNSGYPNTWFPYQGFLSFTIGEFSKGSLIKPGTKINFSNINQFFSEFLLNYLDELSDKENIVGRFGNQEAMFLSMLIGGGFWNTAEGQCLRDYICENYKKEIELLKYYYGNELEEIRLINDNKFIPVLSDDVEINKLNQWLEINSSKMKICELTFKNKKFFYPRVDFSSESFDIKYIQPKSFPYQVKQKQKVIEALNSYLRERGEHLRWYQSDKTGANRAHFYKNLLKRKEEENNIYENIVIYAIFSGKSGPHLQKKIYQALNFDNLRTAMLDYQSRINETYKGNQDFLSIIHVISFIVKEIRRFANNNKTIGEMTKIIELLDKLSLSQYNNKIEFQSYRGKNFN